MTILLVDDDDFMRSLLTRYLEEAGFTVESENNVQDAYEKLVAGDYGLLISDIIMPGADGTKLMRRVREQGMDIPILGITGGVENAQEDYAHLADMFADETLVKPIARDVLVEAVKRMTA